MRDMATYNWPCVNTGLGRKMPTIFNVYPCALLMVMPDARRTGNWRTGNPPACEDLWVGPRVCAKREHWLRKSHVHAYMRACVQDTALFFLASRPNPKHCADSPLTQPSRATNQRVVAVGRQQVQWAGVCDEHTDRQTPRLDSEAMSFATSAISRQFASSLNKFCYHSFYQPCSLHV